MPEGPEVRRQADRIQKAVGGRKADRVFFGLEALAARGPELSGRRVEHVEARGKALLTHFEGGLSVYSHNQLYGRWYIVKAGRPPRTNRQLRFAIETSSQDALLYSASDIEVLETAAVSEHPFIAALGPDALDPTVGPDLVEARLERFRRRQLGALLLDQRFVAGLGNYLRSEILFFSGVLPERRAMDLAPGRRARLAREILEVTRRAYRTGGITVEDELSKQLKQEGLPRGKRRHHVFARLGHTCRRCETPIDKRDVAGRRVYVCPGCQT
ncbi:MAG: endonuclease VIII [Myxococcota bacterium]